MTGLWNKFVPENIDQLVAYQPGKPVEELERELGIVGAVKIASNENPSGPSPKAVAAAAEALTQSHFYPDGGAHHLRHAIAARRGVSAEEIVVGAGSNEIIGMIVRAFCEPGRDEIVAHRYAFISYRLFAMAHNVKFVETEVDANLRCDVEALVAACNENTKVVFLANPNNPTGAFVGQADFASLVDRLPPRALLVVDEAYHEYAAHWSEDYPNSQDHRTKTPRIVTLRTFSKIYGLAGLRLGYAIADRHVIDYLNRVRRPFNAASASQAAAMAALEDEEHVRASREVTANSLEALRATVDSLGCRAFASLANFILVDVGRPSGDVYQQLLLRGVIVRPMAAWGLPQHVRISAVAPEQLDKVQDALRAVLA